ncbi:MAG: hypothetical protein QF535_16655 [Anaerolineales bacterium]|nr:hypothetical protein [Anaerolineales bacterium]
MDFETGRPDHIQDVLVRLHTQQWFGWSDSKNKVYSNLIIHDKIWDETYTGSSHKEGMIDNPYSKPTQEFLESELQRMQDEFDAQDYARDRAKAYPSLKDQMDMQYHDAVDGTTTWQDAVKAVKEANPKPE